MGEEEWAQRREQNERRSEGANHKVGPGGNVFKYFGKTVFRGSKKWKNMEKAESNGVTRSWIGAELTKQMQEVLCLL